MQEQIRISQRVCELQLHIRELESDKKEVSEAIKDVKDEVQKLLDYYKMNKDSTLDIRREGGIVKYFTPEGDELHFTRKEPTLFSQTGS